MNNNPGILTNVLNGLNSTLNIVNKAIPIYKEAKPIINTVTNTYKKVKNNGADLKKVIKLMKLKNEIKKDVSSTNIQNTFNLPKTTNQTINNPKFFI